MRYQEIPPSPTLAGVVRCLWFLDASASAARRAGEPALPDGSPELIVNLGDPIWARVATGVWRRQPRAMLVGQITGPLTVRPSGRLRLAAVRFEAAGACLLHRPMSTLTDRWLDLSADPSLGTKRLLPDLAAARTTRQRSAILDDWVRDLNDRRPGPDRRVVQAAAAIRASHGTTAVEHIGRDFGTSARRLQRLFGRDVGIGPKLLARICRFQRVFGTWRRHPASLTRVAIECGYFDQPHLIRDFRDFAGVAPARFLASQPAFTALFTR